MHPHMDGISGVINVYFVGHVKVVCLNRFKVQRLNTLCILVAAYLWHGSFSPHIYSPTLNDESISLKLTTEEKKGPESPL